MNDVFFKLVSTTKRRIKGTVSDGVECHDRVNGDVLVEDYVFALEP